MSQKSPPTLEKLTRDDVGKLLQEVGPRLEPLTPEKLERVREQLCPGAAISLGYGLEDLLQYWIEHEPNPTRELLEVKLALVQPLESRGAEKPKPGVVKGILGAIAERGKKLLSSDEKDLIEACGKGEREKVNNLLKNVKPNIVHKGRTPLLAASLMGHLDIVMDLINAKADVNFIAEGKEGRPALNAACSHGRREVAEYLLDVGASVNAMDGEKYTALHEAAFNGHPEVVELLIKSRADLEMKTDDGSTALMLASAGGDVETVELLLKSGAKSSHRLPKWGRTAIHNAASRGQAKVVELLLKATDCPIDDQDSGGITPLIMAVKGSLQRATPDKRVKARADLLETVKFLVDAGANLNLQTKSGETALISAVSDRRVDEVEVLVQAGADLDIQEEKKGWSAIFFAAEKGSMHIAQLLCGAGASLELLDKEKRTVMDVAQTYSPSVHQMLKGMKEASKKQKQTPLMLSSYYKTDDRYPGVYFYGSPLKQSVMSSGTHITSWWEEIGVEFQIPPGAVPEGESLDLSVWPCCSGPFQLPDGYELASPMFLISPSFKFADKITIKMEHFVRLEDEECCDEMVFLSAPTTPQSTSDSDKEPNYPCRVLGKGIFVPGWKWGKIALTHFCFSGIGRRKRCKGSSTDQGTPASKKMKKRYVYQVYRDRFEDIAIFSAFLDHNCYFTALGKSVKEIFPDLRPASYVEISVVGDKLSLEWPSNSGWEVISDRDPCMLTKTALASNKKVPYPPMIKLEVERERNGDSISTSIASHICFSVVGIAEESRFKLKPKPRQGQSPLSSMSSDPFSPPPLLSPQQQQISPQWSTQPHTEVISSSNLPQGQSKTASTSVRSSQPCTLELLLDNIRTTDWYHLGLKLIHDESELNFIEKDNLRDSKTALRKMFQLARERDPDLSWPKVVEALRAINQSALARDIEQKFCPN